MLMALSSTNAIVKEFTVSKLYHCFGEMLDHVGLWQTFMISLNHMYISENL